MTLPFLTPAETLIGPLDTDVSTGHDAGTPVTLTPDTVVDAWGDYVFASDDESDAGSGGTIGITGTLAHTDTAGVRNGDFGSGPPDPAEPLSDDNPLPGWTLGVDGDDCFEAWWVALDDGSHAVRFIVRPDSGSTSGTMWLEQVIPVSGGVELARAPHLTEGAVDPTCSARWYRSLQCLRADGTTTGSECDDATWAVGGDLNGSSTSQVVCPIPVDARYLRLRVGAANTYGSGDDTSAELGGVWCGPSRFEPVTLTFEETTALPASGAVTLTIGDVAYGKWVAPWVCFVTSVSVVPKADRTSGSLAFKVRDESTGASPGPVATLDAVHYTHASAVATSVATTDVIPAGDIIRGIATVTSGTFAPTANGAVMVVTIATLPWAT